jgi:2-dehydro-3-deoxyphosphogluconate aldolase/(4S)-4-hydroxy-2-oxoglutarate aldolase
MDGKEVVKKIEQEKIMVIIRGKDYETIEKITDAVYKGGIRCCEVPFDGTGKTPDEQTADNISKLVKKFPDMVIGAGTVLKKSQVILAKKAGAKFIVAPDVNCAIIKKTKKLKLVSIPGALTPSEATLAHRTGADFVKLFPNGEMKESYIKTLKVPLPHVKFIAFGGVYPHNLAQVLANGASVVGVATGIVAKKSVETNHFEEITENAKEYLEIIKNA